MFEFILALLTSVRVFFRSRSETALEILALRQQIVVLKRKRPRPRLNQFDRLFWIILRCVWSRWTEVSGQTRDSRRLASGGISTLLEVAIASTCWPTESYCRNSGTHPPAGRTECDLGSIQDPWRTPETRLRYLRANRSSVSATCWAPR